MSSGFLEGLSPRVCSGGLSSLLVSCLGTFHAWLMTGAAGAHVRDGSQVILCKASVWILVPAGSPFVVSSECLLC